MKQLKIDLELLVQSFSFNEDDLGKEYLDTHTGDIINIPYEVNKVVQGKVDEDDLADWQKELLEEGYAIEEDTEDRYILVPNIDDSYFYDAMVNYARNEVDSEDLKGKLLYALNKSQPMKEFKNVIFKDAEELDKWQDFEEKKLKEYATNWLSDRGIEIE